jgi:hypothetical protein
VAFLAHRFKAPFPVPQFLWIPVSAIPSLHQSPIRIKAV